MQIKTQLHYIIFIMELQGVIQDDFYKKSIGYIDNINRKLKPSDKGRHPKYPMAFAAVFILLVNVKTQYITPEPEEAR
jgi:hypothetical protein